MVCGWEYMLNNIVDTVRVLILYMYGTTADSYFRPLEFPHALQQEAATVHQNTEMAWRPTYSGVVSVNGRAPVGHGAFRRASISYQLRRCWWLPYSYRLRKKRCLLRSSCKQASVLHAGGRGNAAGLVGVDSRKQRLQAIQFNLRELARNKAVS